MGEAKRRKKLDPNYGKADFLKPMFAIFYSADVKAFFRKYQIDLKLAKESEKIARQCVTENSGERIHIFSAVPQIGGFECTYDGHSLESGLSCVDQKFHNVIKSILTDFPYSLFVLVLDKQTKGDNLIYSFFDPETLEACEILKTVSHPTNRWSGLSAMNSFILRTEKA